MPLVHRSQAPECRVRGRKPSAHHADSVMLSVINVRSWGCYRPSSARSGDASCWEAASCNCLITR